MSPEIKKEAKKDKFSRNFCIVFTAVFLFLYWPGVIRLPVQGVFSHMEDVWVDLLFRFRMEKLPAGDPKITVAALDEETGKKYGFPVPRRMQARLIDKLKEYGAKTVAFDVMFFDPREGDAELSAATRRFGRVVHLFATEVQDTPHGQVITVNEPIAGVKAAAQYLGYPNIQDVLDSDGHVRRSMLFDRRIQDPRDPSVIAPSMDAAIAASYLDKPLAELRAEYGEPEPRIMLINFRKPVEWLRHPKRDAVHVGKVQNLETVPSPYQRISALDILSGELTPEQRAALQGGIVIVGSTALGYFDHYPSPFNPAAPGVEYHANHIDNLIHGDFLRATPRLYILLILVFMIWLPMVLRRVPPVVGNAAVAGVMVFWLVFTYWRFAQGIRTDLISPLVALFLSFLVQNVHRVLTEGAEKKFIKQTFGQFVSPDVVEKLVQDPSLVKLGGEKRNMTVLFLDIAHFTTISEKMPPESLILFLNKYLSALSAVIQAHKGTIDKYIGDCVMAFWNAPLDDAEHRAHACRAAVECQEKMAELNKDLDPNLSEVPAIRIGLNSGDMTVGLTGSERKLAYTVIGDEVNLASRLEGANKFFGSRIMVSEAVYEGGRSVAEARELGRVLVVGKAIPIKVYELLARKGELSAQWRQALPLYEQGMAHFAQREFERAVVDFEGVLKIFPKDGPANFYVNVSRDYSAIPPPEDWDGVIKLTAK
ncbi:MAG: adenylate/guanylate cyclase domain-containing protein [Elusimicrobiota bacterium]